MTDQLKLIVGVSGAVLGLVVGIGIGLIVNSGGGDEPIRPVVSSLVDTTIPPVTTSDAPIAVAP
jgi:ABC-type antimicrobial peptide transport system permease subunit